MVPGWQEAVGPWMLGRWSRALKVGLVGMPKLAMQELRYRESPAQRPSLAKRFSLS